MTRRGLFAPLLGLAAAACSPLSLLNAVGPRDRGAERVARGRSSPPSTSGAAGRFPVAGASPTTRASTDTLLTDLLLSRRRGTRAP